MFRVRIFFLCGTSLLGVRRILIGILAVLQCSHAWGAAAEAGQPGGFMRAGVGGRAAAMGDAYVALAEGPEAVYWNPAGLAFGSQPSLASTYNVLSLDRQSTDAELMWDWDPKPETPTAGSFPMAMNRGWGAWGLGWMGFSLGNDFEARTTDTPTYTTFGDHQDEYSLSHGRALLSWLAVGANLKFYDHIIDGYSAHGEGMDLGTLLLLGPQVRLGVTVSDLLSNFSWSTGYTEQFPVTIRASLAGSTWKDRVTISGQIEDVEGQQVNFGLGVEGVVFKYLKLRGGLQQNGATFGAGFLVPVSKMECALDYAFLPDPLEQGNEQRFSLELNF